MTFSWRARFCTCWLLVVFVFTALAGAQATDRWIAAGFTNEGRVGIRSAFQTAIHENLIAGGSVLLVKDDRPILNEAFGFADIENNRPFTTDTVAHLASTSKPHTSKLLMMLVDEGLIELDTPVSNYVSELRGMKLQDGQSVEAPTMRQLLSHTAGFEGLAKAGCEKTIELVFANRRNFSEAARAIAEDGLVYRPGTEYRYTQLGMVVAAHVAETVTGQDFETLG